MNEKQFLETIESYCETGSNVLLKQIEEYCSKHDLFFAEDEDCIMIEDDVYYKVF